MKKLLWANIFICCLASVSAQTYRDGVWYSIYDTETHTMNTQGDYATGGIFAPTGGQLNVQWKYEWIDLFGAFSKVNTQVLESADGGKNTTQRGKLQENTGNNSNTTEHFTVSRNINWIKFNRPDDEGLNGPTHKVSVYHIDIPLARHILLPSGDYGTTTASHDFGSQKALSASSAYHVDLRSFLSAADITVTSSAPEIFRIGSADNTEGLKYAVGANACASSNGKAEAAGGGTLGNIAGYGFDIYFVPQEGKDYQATVTITDGVSAATVEVKGAGIKLEQSITWEQQTENPVLSNGAIETATASSGLDVTYTFEPEGIVSFEGGILAINGLGKVSVTASQAGNGVYNAAEPVVKELTVIPAETSYAYSAAICEGEVYSDENFENLTTSDLYYDTIPNIYGTDSVIVLTLKVNPVYSFDEGSREIYEGTNETWQGVDFSLLPVGDTLLVAEYATVSGCDAVYKLNLSVVVRPTTYGNETFVICAGDTAVYAGKKYVRPTVDGPMLIEEKNIYGGDSLVTVNVSVLPLKRIDDAPMTITEGDDAEWQHIDLGQLPVGDTTLVAVYTAANGCDSTYTISVTVKEKVATGLNKSQTNNEKVQKTVINGRLYIRKGEALYDCLGGKVTGADN